MRAVPFLSSLKRKGWTDFVTSEENSVLLDKTVVPLV
jgi:hypothetical protein